MPEASRNNPSKRSVKNIKTLVWVCNECKTPCYEPYLGKGKHGKFIKPECCAWDEASIDSKWLLKKIEIPTLLNLFTAYQKENP